MSKLDEAIKLAVDAHSGQTDKGGAPYILHPLRVMGKMTSEEQRIVAVLHDVVEDSDTPISTIYDQFGHAIGAAVDALTKREGEAYWEYLERVATDDLARKVKMADLSDNIDLSRLGRQPNEADLRRKAKYQEAAGYLFKQPNAHNMRTAGEQILQTGI